MKRERRVARAIHKLVVKLDNDEVDPVEPDYDKLPRGKRRDVEEAADALCELWDALERRPPR